MVSPWISGSSSQQSQKYEEDYASSTSLQESSSWNADSDLYLLPEVVEIDEPQELGVIVDEFITLGSLDDVAFVESLGAYPPQRLYEQLIVQDNPWGAWKLDEASGSVFEDYSGNDNDLTITGSLLGMAVEGPSQSRKAASFPASTGVYATGGTTSTAGLETWEAWVKLDTAPAGNLTLLSGAANTTGTANVERGLLIGTDLKPQWNAYGGSPSGWTQIIAPTAVSLGVWHHIVGVLDGTNMILYVDGTQVASTAKNTGSWAGRPVRLHAGYNAGNAAAVMSEAAIYPSALSALRIAEHYSAMTDPDPAIEENIAATPVFLSTNTSLIIDVEASVTRTGDFGVLVSSSDVEIPLETSTEIFFTPDNTYLHPKVPILPFPSGSQTLNIENGQSRWYRFEPVDDPGQFLVAFSSTSLSAKLYWMISETDSTVTLSSALKTFPSSSYNIPESWYGRTLFIEILSTDNLEQHQFVWDYVTPPYYDNRLTPYVISSTEYGQTDTLDLFGCTKVSPYYPGTFGDGWLSFSYPSEVDVTFSFECSQKVVVSTFVGGVHQDSVVSLNPVIRLTTTDLIEIRVSTLTGMGTFKVSWSITPEFIEPETFADYLRVEVYERDGITKITELPRRFSPQAQELLNGIGSGSVQVHADDPIVRAYGPDLFKYRNIIKFFLGNKCIYAFRVRSRESTWVSSSEYTGTVRTISGPTAIEILNDAHLLHDRLASISSTESRTYNWTSFHTKTNDTIRPWYKPVEWSQGFLQSSLKNPPGGYKRDGAGNIIGQKPKKKRKKYGYPTDWPFETARWIFCNKNPQINAFHGWPGLVRPNSSREYYRKQFYVPERVAVYIAATADEWYDVYIDGIKILEQENYEIGYKSYTYATYVLSQGWHVIAASTIKRGGYKGTGLGDQNDSLLLGIGEFEGDIDTSEDGDPTTAIGNVIVVSNTIGWQCYIGDNVPGWTKANILESFIEESVTRGVIPSHILNNRDWDSATDSYGVAWERRFWDKEFSIGTKGTEFVQNLTEGNGFDVWLDPGTFVLRAAPVRGVDKSASIRLEPRRNVMDWGTSSTEDVINSFYIHYGDGWKHFYVPESIAKYGKTEGYITLGDIDSPTKVDEIMNQLVSQLSKPGGEAGSIETKFKALGQPAGSITAVPGAVPFLDFSIGDRISAMNEYGNYNTYRVIGLTVTEDSNGQLSFDPELELVGLDVVDVVLSPPTNVEDIGGGTGPDPGGESPEGLLYTATYNEDYTQIIPPPVEDTPQLVIDEYSPRQEYIYDGSQALFWKIEFDAPGTYILDSWNSTLIDDTTSGTVGEVGYEPYVPIGDTGGNPSIAVTALTPIGDGAAMSRVRVVVSAPTVWQFYSIGVSNLTDYGPCKISVKYSEDV